MHTGESSGRVADGHASFEDARSFAVILPKQRNESTDLAETAVKGCLRDGVGGQEIASPAELGQSNILAGGAPRRRLDCPTEVRCTDLKVLCRKIHCELSILVLFHLVKEPLEQAGVFVKDFGHQPEGIGSESKQQRPDVIPFASRDLAQPAIGFQAQGLQFFRIRPGSIDGPHH